VFKTASKTAVTLRFILIPAYSMELHHSLVARSLAAIAENHTTGLQKIPRQLDGEKPSWLAVLYLAAAAVRVDSVMSGEEGVGKEKNSMEHPHQDVPGLIAKYLPGISIKKKQKAHHDMMPFNF
jgi:hypothetical protein